MNRLTINILTFNFMLVLASASSMLFAPKLTWEEIVLFIQTTIAIGAIFTMVIAVGWYFFEFDEEESK